MWTAADLDATMHGNRLPSQNSNSSNTTTSTHEKMELGQAQASMHRGQKKDNDAWKKEATCHHCGKKGHIKPDCFSFQRSQGKSAPQKGKGKPARANLAQ